MIQRCVNFTIKTPLGRAASILIGFECDEASSADVARDLIASLEGRLRAACARRSCTVEHSFSSGGSDKDAFISFN